jgi:hypothetical protein
VWAVQAGSLDAAVVPLLVAVNTVLAVVLQAPLSAVAEKPGGGLRAMGLGVVALAASCGVFALVGLGPTWLAPVTMVAGVVLLTLSEVWQSAGEWELSYAFAPDDRRTLYLSVFSLSKTVQSTVGPALLAVALLPLGRVGWLVLAGVLLVAWPVLVRVVRVLERRTVVVSEAPGG